jgi:hypothetical protein
MEKSLQELEKIESGDRGYTIGSLGAVSRRRSHKVADFGA